LVIRASFCKVPGMSELGTRRERRRERARRELVASARALIATHGVATIRVSDVAERADVAHGTVYNHFETKDELIEAVVDDAVTELVTAVGDYGDQLADAAEAMSVGIRQLVGLCDRDPDLARVLVHLSDAATRFEQLLWERSERILLRGLEDGRFRSADATLSLTLAIGATLAAIRAIVVGRLAIPGAAAQCAAGCLQAVGVSYDDAQEIVSRPLPTLDPRTSPAA
jgi:AcrR family transcriptional regulator